MKTQHLPRTDSIQELANFWDTHDLADFEDELEEVTEPVFEVSTRTHKILWGWSGGKCAICKNDLIIDPTTLKDVESVVGGRSAHYRPQGILHSRRF